MSSLTFIMLIVAALAVLYKLNSQLAYYQVENHRGWFITDKISTVVKYMMIGGVIAVLPVLYVVTFDSNAKFNDYLWIINLGFLGRDCLLLALPILITSLVWRTYLSPIPVMTIVVRTLKPHSKKIMLGLLGIGVLVMLIPYLSIILALGFLYVLRDIGLLDGEDEEHTRLSSEDSSYALYDSLTGTNFYHTMGGPDE